MNNRKTAGVSPQAANPRRKKEERQRQRHADELYATIVVAGNFACREAGGIGLTHLYAAMSSGNDKGPGLPRAFVARQSASLISANC
jgi:hypothetical protein